MQRSSKLKLTVRVKNHPKSEVFPAIELADVLDKFARDMRHQAYSGIEIEPTGTYLSLQGGVEWEYETGEVESDAD